MNKEIEIPEGYEARIEGNKVILVLKESEDERIRKCLIAALKCAKTNNGTVYIGNEYLDEYITYLEKQKEQTGKKWIYEDDYKSQLDAQYQQGLEDGRRDQKPAEWSEEDYNAILIAIDWLQYYRDTFVATEAAKDEITTCVERLKSLRPQPKQKWSEEDKEMINTIIESLSWYMLHTRGVEEEINKKTLWLNELLKRF